MGPVTYSWMSIPRDLTACPLPQLQGGDTGIHHLGIWGGSCGAQNLPGSGIMLPLGSESSFKASPWCYITSSEPDHHIQLPWEIMLSPKSPLFLQDLCSDGELERLRAPVQTGSCQLLNSTAARTEKGDGKDLLRI